MLNFGGVLVPKQSPDMIGKIQTTCIYCANYIGIHPCIYIHIPVIIQYRYIYIIYIYPSPHPQGPNHSSAVPTASLEVTSNSKGVDGHGVG